MLEDAPRSAIDQWIEKLGNRLIGAVGAIGAIELAVSDGATDFSIESISVSATDFAEKSVELKQRLEGDAKKVILEWDGPEVAVASEGEQYSYFLVAHFEKK